MEACLIAMLPLEATRRVIACLLANLKGESILKGFEGGKSCLGEKKGTTIQINESDDCLEEQARQANTFIHPS